MKRSFQEVVELVVFGLIALLIGVGVLWLVGWVLGLVGLLMKFLAGLIWWLLRYIVPIAIVAGLIYFLVRVLQGDRSGRAAPATPAPAGTGAASGPVTQGSSSTLTSAGTPAPGPEGPADAQASAAGEAGSASAGGEVEAPGSAADENVAPEDTRSEDVRSEDPERPAGDGFEPDDEDGRHN